MNEEIAEVVNRYNEGQLQSQSTVIDGIREGLVRRWDNNGRLENEENYVNDECIECE